ncbi:MAG: A24 family peptidase [Actinomycetota bacterium]|nr:A24 family peptidase [Actinomycetota bacterium]
MDLVLVIVCAAIGAALAPALTAVPQRVLRPQPTSPNGPVTEPGPASQATVPIALATAALWAAAAWRFGLSPTLPVHLVVWAALVVVTVIDLDHKRIPDRLVFPTLAFAGLAMIGISLLDGDTDRLTRAGLGAAVYFVALFVPHLVYPRGMGFGDVKLALVLGLLLGWQTSSPDEAVRAVLSAMLLGSALGALSGLALLVARRRNDPFPFGPALVASTIIVLLAGVPVW